MITNLEIVDDETVRAEGDRYELPKVLDAICGLLDDYAAFARDRGFPDPYTFAMPAPRQPDDDWVSKLLKAADIPVKLPYGVHTTRHLRTLVMKEAEWCDAGGLRHFMEAPPYRFDAYALAQHPLYANFGLCRSQDVREEWVTCEGLPWTEYDPAPFVRIFRHLPPLDDDAPERPSADLRLTAPQRKALTDFLGTQRRRGITFETRANGLVEEPVTLRFPHDVFGAGHGPIRIATVRAGGD